MPHRKLTAAAIAILAFAAASSAFAQRGNGGDDLLVGGRTSHQASSAQTGGGTVSDDVIVDGRIITGENYDSAPAPFDPQFTGGVFVGAASGSPKGATAGGGSFGVDDPGFRGGARASDGTQPAKGGSFFAYGQDFQGGVRVATGDVNGDGAQGASRHSGGINVLMGDGSVRGVSQTYGDGSVRGLSSNIGTGGFDAPKGGSLGSLNGIGSIGQLGGPGIAGAAGAKTATVAPLGVARAGGDAKGDGIGDIITGAGPGGSPHVKSGAGGRPPVKVYIAPSDTATRAGAGPHVKVFDGNAGAAAGATKTMTMKGQTIKQN